MFKICFISLVCLCFFGSIIGCQKKNTIAPPQEVQDQWVKPVLMLESGEVASSDLNRILTGNEKIYLALAKNPHAIDPEVQTLSFSWSCQSGELRWQRNIQSTQQKVVILNSLPTAMWKPWSESEVASCQLEIIAENSIGSTRTLRVDNLKIRPQIASPQIKLIDMENSAADVSTNLVFWENANKIRVQYPSDAKATHWQLLCDDLKIQTDNAQDVRNLEDILVKASSQSLEAVMNRQQTCLLSHYAEDLTAPLTIANVFSLVLPTKEPMVDLTLSLDNYLLNKKPIPLGKLMIFNPNATPISIRLDTSHFTSLPYRFLVLLDNKPTDYGHIGSKNKYASVSWAASSQAWAVSDTSAWFDIEAKSYLQIDLSMNPNCVILDWLPERQVHGIFLSRAQLQIPIHVLGKFHATDDLDTEKIKTIYTKAPYVPLFPEGEDWTFVRRQGPHAPFAYSGQVEITSIGNHSCQN